MWKQSRRKVSVMSWKGLFTYFLNCLSSETSIYSILFLLTLYINKYVLSVLGFKYPTVYQGWLTLIGSFTLYWLRPRIPKSEASVGSVQTSLFRHLPLQCLFVVTIVTGSKALASTPIGVFLGAQNVPTLCAVLCQPKILPRIEFVIGLTGLLSTFILLLHIDTILQGTDQAWLLGFIVSLSMTEVFQENLDCQNRQVTVLYYKNIFSFIILAPASLYLGEAFTALDFKYLDQFWFYSCCLVAGMAGAVQQTSAVKLKTGNNYHSTASCVKPVAALLSIPLFQDPVPSSLWFLIAVNISSAVILVYLMKSDDKKYAQPPPLPIVV